jgi:hypothetical protein
VKEVGETNGYLRLTLAARETDVAEIADFIWRSGLRLRHLSEERPSLEQAFMDLTEGKVA